MTPPPSPPTIPRAPLFKRKWPKSALLPLRKENSGEKKYFFYFFVPSCSFFLERVVARGKERGKNRLQKKCILYLGRKRSRFVRELEGVVGVEGGNPGDLRPGLGNVPLDGGGIISPSDRPRTNDDKLLDPPLPFCLVPPSGTIRKRNLD
ncbi:hypothetical protein CDAR_68821 [Caerostris darwini]|uniref:Uncharacterized protein n=1 Tax=Caerostris darwini TaxID=1538125 RepID=A0AAV4X0A5_9ARAC|nr:hypothetical protein CDAR_68821 [Caerostris darwini]